MDVLLHAALNNAVWATALALAATAGAWVWRRRPALAHTLWLLVLLKLVTPSLIRLPFPGGDVSSAAVSGPVRPVTVSQPDSVPGPPTIPPEVRAGSAVIADAPLRLEESRVIAPSPRSSGVEFPTVPGWSWRLVLGAIWVGGAVAWWSSLGLAMMRFRRLMRSARPAAPEVPARLAALAEGSGLRRVPSAWIVPARVPPMLWVPLCGRPRLVLPEELWGRLDDVQQTAILIQQQTAILIHELAHLGRRDHWVRRLEAAVLGLYWWEPVAWWARRRLERAEEECCDAWVVRLLPSAVGAYAEALVATAAYLAGVRRPLPPGVSGVGRVETIKRRLQMILSDEPDVPAGRPAPRTLLVLGMLALSLLPAAALDGPARARAQEAVPHEKSAIDQAADQAEPARDGAQQTADGVRKVENPEGKTSPAAGNHVVKACRPVWRELRDPMIYPGTFEAAGTVSVRPLVGGLIVEVAIQPGQKVRRGDLLFAIDPRRYKAQLEKAEAEVRIARGQLEAKKAEAEFAAVSARERSDRGKVIQLRLEVKTAEASVEAAEKSQDIARLNLQFTRLESPIDGTVLGSVVQAGNVAVADTTNLAQIVSTDPMYLHFRVDQAIALELTHRRIDGKLKMEPGKGFPVVVDIQNEAAPPRQGFVDLMNGAVHPGTGTVQWRAKVSNPDDLLWPGMSAQVRLPIGEPRKSLVIPERAVFRDPREQAVMLVSEKGDLEGRRVTTGTQQDGTFEITSGLKDDEWVVISPVPVARHWLRQGERVKVERVPMPDGASSGQPGLR